MTGIEKREVWKRSLGLAILLVVASASAAAAPEAWDCTYEGYGADPARYVVHFERRGSELVQPYLSAPISYRILVDTRDILVAVRAHAEPRRDAGAIVVIIDKRTGRLRRSAITTGDGADEVLAGRCETY